MVEALALSLSHILFSNMAMVSFQNIMYVNNKEVIQFWLETFILLIWTSKTM